METPSLFAKGGGQPLPAAIAAYSSGELMQLRAAILIQADAEDAAAAALQRCADCERRSLSYAKIPDENRRMGEALIDAWEKQAGHFAYDAARARKRAGHLERYI